MITDCNLVLYEQCKGLWREVFGDTDDFINYYFKERTSPDYILCDVGEKGELRGMLHIIPKRIRFNQVSYKAMLIAGVAVYEKYRGNGIATQLLKRAEIYAKQMNSSYLLLQPESIQLFDFYKKFGYSELGKHIIFSKQYIGTHKPKAERLNTNPELLLSIYNNYMRRADGYVERRIKGFNSLLNEVKISDSVVVATSTAYAFVEIKKEHCYCYELCGELSDCLLAIISNAANRDRIEFNISPFACEINSEVTRFETIPFNMIKPINGKTWDTSLEFNTYERY